LLEQVVTRTGHIQRSSLSSANLTSRTTHGIT